MAIEVILKIGCPDHPKYAGDRSPGNRKSPDGKWCDNCWQIYDILHLHAYMKDNGFVEIEVIKKFDLG